MLARFLFFPAHVEESPSVIPLLADRPQKRQCGMDQSPLDVRREIQPMKKRERNVTVKVDLPARRGVRRGITFTPP